MAVRRINEWRLRNLRRAQVSTAMEKLAAAAQRAGQAAQAAAADVMDATLCCAVAALEGVRTGFAALWHRRAVPQEQARPGSKRTRDDDGDDEERDAAPAHAGEAGPSAADKRRQAAVEWVERFRSYRPKSLMQEAGLPDTGRPSRWKNDPVAVERKQDSVKANCFIEYGCGTAALGTQPPPPEWAVLCTPEAARQALIGKTRAYTVPRAWAVKVVEAMEEKADAVDAAAQYTLTLNGPLSEERKAVASVVRWQKAAAQCRAQLANMPSDEEVQAMEEEEEEQAGGEAGSAGGGEA